MRSLVLGAEHLGKCFRVATNHRTALRVLRAMVGGRPLTSEVWVLRDVSFQIRPGERVAILGRNGSGKTTLLRMIAGIYDRSCGRLVVNQPPQALFSYAAGFHPDLAVIDNLFLFGAMYGMTRQALAREQNAIVEEAGLDHLRDAPLKVLSTGQVQRLALCVFSRTAADFLIFDEAASNVDLGFLESFDLLFARFAALGKTLLVTSHDASFLRAHCDRALWLEDGRVRLQGPLESVLEAYEASFERGDPQAKAR